MVVGEHGTSEVLLWSSATVGGIPALELLGNNGQSLDAVCKDIEEGIRYANITIIEGTGPANTASGPSRHAWSRRCCATNGPSYR